jgi:hypothetical protein
MSAPDNLVRMHQALLKEFSGTHLGQEEIHIEGPSPWESPEHRILVGIKFSYEDDGDAENGPHLSISVLKYFEIFLDQKIAFWNFEIKNPNCNCEKGCPDTCTGACGTLSPDISRDSNITFRLSPMLLSPENFAARLRAFIVAFQIDVFESPLPGAEPVTCDGTCGCRNIPYENV